MPLTFAADALSTVDRLLGPQRHGASFGDPIDIESGAYTFTTTDISVHGRGLNFAFSRRYSSLDDWYEPDGSSYMGPGWRHSYWWEIYAAPQGGSGCGSTLIRGDGTRERIVADGTNGNFLACAFSGGLTTVTMRDQTRYVFGNRFDFQPGETTVYSDYELIRIELPTGDRVVLTYAGSPLGPSYEPVLSTVTDTVGRPYHFSYDALAHLVRVDDPSGRAATFGYDALGRLVSATDPTGATTHYGYDGGSRHVTTNTDPDGRVRATNTYNSAGQVNQQVDGEGFVTTWSNPSPYDFEVTDGQGTRTTYLYCSCGSGLSTKTTWVGSSQYITAYAYDAFGNRNYIRDRLGQVTNLTYEARANANLLSRSDIGVTAYQYDTSNNVTQITDPRGFVTQRVYDVPTGALITERHQVDASTNATTTYTYSDPTNPGLPSTITSARGSMTHLTYDATGNLVTKIDPDGNVTTYTYDALGRQTSVTDPDGRTTTTAYDADDRVVSVTDPLAHVARTSYDGSGNKISATDRDGNVTSFSFDRNSRLITVQQRPSVGITLTTSFVRDGNGNITRVTQGNGSVLNSTYDAFGKLTSATESTSQGTLTTNYSRDPMGNVLARTTADGLTTSYTYDALSRLTSTTGPGISISYGYDPSGNRTSMTDATGMTTYAFDGLGRLISAAAPGGTLTYSYDLDGNRTGISYPGAGSVTSTYTPGERLSIVTDWAGRQSTYQYLPSGLVSSLTYPNGMVANYSYDAAGRLAQLTNTVGTTTITSHAYTLDPEGNRTAVTEFVSGVTTAGSTDAIAYTYDGLNRLTGSTGAVTESFTLDGASNVTGRTGPSATYTYDGADRVQSDGTLVFKWSKADQLTFHGQPDSPPPPPPAVTFRAQSSANNGIGPSSITISRPTGTQVGDVLLAFVYVNAGGATVDTPAGWSGIGGPVQNVYFFGRAFYHVATASDPASWDWTFGQYYDAEDHAWYPYTGPAVGSILAYGGVDPNTPLSPATASTNNSTSSVTANPITTGYQNELVVASYGVPGQGTAPTPAGWTNRVSTVNGAGGGVTRVEEKLFASAGSTGPLTWSSGGGSVAFMVGLNPPPPPPPPPPPAGDTFTYDALDRLTASTVSSIARSYAYSGDGLLQSRTQASVTTAFLWDPGSSPSRLLQQGADRIVYGLGPLYVVKADGSTVVFARDGGKSVRAEVNSAGAATGSFRYRSYGAVVQSAGSAMPSYFGFASQLEDSSGLVYMRARWYDPTVGRFMTHDMAEGDPVSPSSFNAFSYVGGNPVRGADPSGLCQDPTPGASGIRYCVAAYIPQAVVCGLQCYKGDNRGPEPYGGTSRIQFGIDQDGNIVGGDGGTFSPSDTVRDDESERARARSTCIGGDGTYACVGKNPLEAQTPLVGWALPSIDFTVDLGNGGPLISGTSFPSYEIWQYSPDGTAQLVYNYDATQNPFGAFGLLFKVNLPDSPSHLVPIP